jgi:hypothetical protein
MAVWVLEDVDRRVGSELCYAMLTEVVARTEK